MKTHTIPALLAALCAAFLSACSSLPKTPLYSEAKKAGALVPKKDSAMVFVYWAPHARHVVGVKLYANDALLTPKMGTGCFYAYDAAPGQIRIGSTNLGGNTGAEVAGAAVGGAIAGGPVGAVIAAPLVYSWRKKDFVHLNAAPSETYYVEMYQAFSREKMRQVSKEEGEKGIEKCHWLNPSTN